MSKAFVILGKDLRETFASKSIYFYLLIFVVLSAPYFQSTKSIIGAVVKQGASMAEVHDVAQALINPLFYTLPLILTMLVCSVFSAYAVVLDKAKRTFESLLATPLSLRQVWLGKSLAVALPSVVIGIVVAILVMVALNIAVFMPVAGIILPDLRSVLAGLLLVPVLTFFITTIVTCLQLVMTNPRLASFVFTAVFFGIYLSTVSQLTAKVDFSLIYLAVIVLLVIVTAVLSRSLTKEKIVLSSKG